MSCKKLNNEFKQSEGSNIKEDWVYLHIMQISMQGDRPLKVWEGEIKLFFSVTNLPICLPSFPHSLHFFKIRGILTKVILETQRNMC